MECDSCGAPMRLSETGAYLYCEYCSSLRFVSETDEGAVLTGGETDQKCPVCRIALSPAAVEGQDASYCGRCRGLLLSTRAFRAVIEKRRRRPSKAPALEGADAEGRIVECPRCGVEMARHPYYGPGAAVVDSCGECFVLWLDHPELSIIVAAHG